MVHEQNGQSYGQASNAHSQSPKRDDQRRVESDTHDYS